MKFKKEDISRKLLALFKDASSQRQLKELEWISNLRLFKGQYEPSTLSKIRQYEGSEVFPRYIRSKVKPTISKINQIFFPVTNKSWSIKTDRAQKLPDIVMAEVQQELQQYDQQQVNKDIVKKIIQNILYKYKEKVDYQIDEQLKEMDFENVFKQTNYSAVMFGTGVIKGILTKEKTVYGIVYDEEGNVSQEEMKEYVPYTEYIPVWDIYPDPSTYDPDKMSYVFQRHKMSKRDLILLSKFEGFDKKTINTYISDNPKGDYAKPNWEYQLETLSTEQTKSKNVIGNYSVLEYWGYIDGTLLDNDKFSPSDAYMCNAWILGDKVIKLDYFPLSTPNSIYHFYYYEKDDSSIFGTGLPSILEGTQLTICAAARMIIDNGTSVVGDQLEVNVDLLTPEQNIAKQYPRKIWYREGRGQEAQYPAVRQISGNSHIAEFTQIINLFKQFGDEESNLPAFVWGNPDNLPANTTATGMSQLSSNTNMSIADIVRGYEKENVKILTDLINWNRKYAPEELEDAFSIKYIVEGFGYESQVYKEQMLTALGQFNNSIQPQDEIYINKRNLYQHEIKLLGLPFNDIINTPEEVEAIRQSQQDPEAQQLAKEAEAANVEYTKAKATHMLAKSKETLDKAAKGE